MQKQLSLNLGIKINSENSAIEWNKLVNSHPYFRFEWFDITYNVYGLKPHYVLYKDETGFALIGSFRTGKKKYISLPYLSYSGYFSDSESTLAGLKTYLKNKQIEIDARSLVQLASEPTYVNSIVEINNLEEYWQSLSSNMRSKINRSQKHNYRIEQTNSVDDFYLIYTTNMHRLGTPVHKKQFFIEILKKIPESFILTMYDGAKPIGGMFCLYDSIALYEPFVSTLREYSKTYANYFLYWTAIKKLHSMHLKKFDLGRSTYNSGTYLFKQGFLPKNYTIETKVKYTTKNDSLASIVWQKLPLAFANSLGPHLRRYLP